MPGPQRKSQAVAGSAPDLEAALARRFRAAEAMAAGTDAVVALATPAGRLATLAVERGTLRFDASLAPDATLFFDSAATALALLGGGASPMQAFLHGRFRSDGHLPLVFALIGLFSAPPDAAR